MAFFDNTGVGLILNQLKRAHLRAKARRFLGFNEFYHLYRKRPELTLEAHNF